MKVSKSIPSLSAAALTRKALLLKMSSAFLSRKCPISPPIMTVEAYPARKSWKTSRGLLFAAFPIAVRGSIPKISTSFMISLASFLIAGISSTFDNRLKLAYGAMPPDAITLT